ncbi:alpha/beta hydrolase fold domain-containing protein [Culicoidibacter larvae]|uniref:Alpha/beta hydrolase n=1 Tax=Culicoidibacter larvae TaxID=2579976 RepID=A0A5R8QEQ3_9FIRM|nr:alpha/beta hydrolase fold domain-containing protein [Culicoidibacter larvae]TLG75456.1 alpha/beta hydrolase [Culicoidibacter larvae]
MNIGDRQIHPELQVYAKVIRFLFPDFKRSTFKKMNLLLKLNKFRRFKNMLVKEVYIDREMNLESKLRLVIYSPVNPKKEMTGILWMHGGGYAFGTPEQEVGIIKEFVEAFDCVVVAPDYLLSVEQPYPAALLDCYSALKWMKNYASSYNINAEQLMVGGVSAGGGLAAALAIYARDVGEISIAFQMLIYPMLDDRMKTRTSHYINTPVWNFKSNMLAWQLYLGAYYENGNVPYYAAPGRLIDFVNLPPAYAYVGSLDPFCDETIEYMEQLKEAGVESAYDVLPGCFHGFDVIAPETSPAKLAREKLLLHFKHAQDSFYGE